MDSPQWHHCITIAKLGLQLIGLGSDQPAEGHLLPCGQRHMGDYWRAGRRRAFLLPLREGARERLRGSKARAASKSVFKCTTGRPRSGLTAI